MEIFDELDVSHGTFVRVPGGWIYESLKSSSAGVFVPRSDEFAIKAGMLTKGSDI
jgi:hypothetical protein